VDELLDSLASLSPFSQLSQPGPSTMTQSTLLTRLYRDAGLSPYALAVLTQIILRDLRPLLNPLPRLATRNPTAMLRLKSNLGPAQLELYEAMKCLNPKMLELYSNGKGDIDWCADAIEAISTITPRMQMPCGPIVGVNVQVSGTKIPQRSVNMG
jgi:DNA ligase-4